MHNIAWAGSTLIKPQRPAWEFVIHLDDFWLPVDLWTTLVDQRGLDGADTLAKWSTPITSAAQAARLMLGRMHALENGAEPPKGWWPTLF